MCISNEFVVLDLETTGGNPIHSEIIEIGAVKVVGGEIVDTFNQLIRPKGEISDYITMLTGIDNVMVASMPSIEEVLPQFLTFCDCSVVIGHNIILFDYPMIKAKAVLQGYSFEKEAIDTLLIARKCLQHLPSRKLGDLCEYYHIDLTHAHRAYHDAKATYELFVQMNSEYYREMPEIFIPQKVKWELPKQNPITSKQKKFLLYLLNKHGLQLEEDITQLTKSQASRKIDGIIRDYGK